MTNLFRAGALAAFGVLAVFAALSTQHAAANEPHDGLEFSVGVRGVTGCNTRASDVTCRLPSGQTFVVEVSLDELPDDIPSYGGFDLYVEHAGVTPSEDANNDDWGDCGFPAAFVGDGFVAWGCAIGVPPAGPSSWIGAIGSVTFTCAQSGSVSLVHGAGDKTDLIEMVAENEEGASESVIHSEGADVSETITIECGTLPAETPGEVTQGTPGGPGPTPGPRDGTPAGGGETPGAPEATLEPTAAAQATFAAADSATATAEAGGAPTEEPPDGEGEDDDDSNVWIWIVVGAIIAAIVIGGGGYWYMRSRGGGTPPTDGGATTGNAGNPAGPSDGGAGATGGDAGGSAPSGGGAAPTPTPSSDAGGAGSGDGGGTAS